MKNTNGFVKIDRSILDSPTYKSLNSKRRDIFMTLLLMANYKQNDVIVDGVRYTIMPGQILTSLKSIKEKCASDVSIQNIVSCLLILKKVGFLTSKSTNRFRIITICKWEQYQTQSTSQSTSNQQAINKQPTTNKKVKNVKNNNTPLYPPKGNELTNDDEKIIDFWYQVVGTQIRSKIPENVKAAKELSTLLGKHELGEVLKACRMIRADKYAGKHLFTASSNYIGVKKNLEHIEAYMQGKTDQFSINQPLVIN